MRKGSWRRRARRQRRSISGAPWYDAYKTKDGKWLSVGAIEQRFYAEFVRSLASASAELPGQHDRSGWPVLRRRFAGRRLPPRTRDEWERVFAGSDACVAPVLVAGEVEPPPAQRGARYLRPARRRAAAGAPRRASAARPAEMGCHQRARAAPTARPSLERLGLQRA